MCMFCVLLVFIFLGGLWWDLDDFLGEIEGAGGGKEKDKKTGKKRNRTIIENPLTSSISKNNHINIVPPRQISRKVPRRNNRNQAQSHHHIYIPYFLL